MHFACPVAPITPTHPSKLDVTLLDTFGVTFGTEGESCKLVAHMVVVPDLPNLPPEVMWFRDGEQWDKGQSPVLMIDKCAMYSRQLCIA